ncbi:Uncharacterised protein [Mycobacteroides abscessus]|nr:Uncharacterised protein [Mycobacteroides abscessus]
MQQLAHGEATAPASELLTQLGDHARARRRVEGAGTDDPCGELRGHALADVVSRADEPLDQTLPFSVVEPRQAGRVESLVEYRTCDTQPDLVLDVGPSECARPDRLCDGSEA